MSDNIDDDEALFDDIYEEEPKAASSEQAATATAGTTVTEPKESAKAAPAPASTTDSKASPPPPAAPAAASAATQLAQLAGQSQEAQLPPMAPPSVPQPQQQAPQQAAQQAAQQPPMQPPRQPPQYDANGKAYFHDKVKADLDGKDVGKLFIGGLTWETDEESLGNYFSQYGEVVELHIMRDTATGRSRGFAFLTFADAKSVDEVLKKKHVLDGKLIDPKRAIPKEEQDKTGKIFVGGIAPDVTRDEFAEYFRQFGDIIDSQLMIDKDTGKSRGYGFVTYDSSDAVERVTRQKYVMFHGRQMEIKKAEPRNQQRGRQYGSYGSGQFGGYMQPGAGQPMMNPYMQQMGGQGYYNQGNMAQYWQQMQQMQQYWMQMQRQGQGQQQPQQEGDEQGDHQAETGDSPAHKDDDDVPNPQERAAPKLPSGPKGFHNRRGGSSHGGGARGRGGHHHRANGRGRRGGGYHPYRR